jgi:hypothetical protein
MTEKSRGPLGWVGHVLAQILVGIWVIVDSILSPIFRPFMRWLSGLHVVKAIEHGIASLPAYGILALLAAPFAAEEIVKIYSFVLMGGGHFKTGVLLYIGCHVFAILVCERIYRAGETKLMTIPWFARFITWLSGYKERLVAWAKSTIIYRRAAELKNQLRQAARLFLRRTKTALGR